MKHFIILTLTLFCICAAQAKEFEVDGILYVENYYNPKELYVVGSSPVMLYRYELDCLDTWPWGWSDEGFYSGTVIIPRTVTYEGTEYTVTRIAYGAFDNCVNLTTVIIPDTVYEIGSGAFYNCKSLKTVRIEGKVRYIDYYTFYGCDALESLNLNNVTGICSYTAGKNLKELILPYDALIYSIDGNNNKINMVCYNPQTPGVQSRFENFKEGSVTYTPSPDEYFLYTSWNDNTGFTHNIDFKHIDEYEPLALAPVPDIADGWRMQGRVLSADGENAVEVYDVAGRLINTIKPHTNYSLYPGIYILRCGQKSGKVAVE